MQNRCFRQIMLIWLLNCSLCLVGLFLFGGLAYAEKPKKQPEKMLKNTLKKQETVKNTLKEAATSKPSKQPKAKKPFGLTLSGYIQAGGRFTLNDESSLRIGESDGFYLRRARFSLLANGGPLQAVLSFEGASDGGAKALDVSPGSRSLHFGLRDAYVRYEHKSGFFATIGQFRVPFGQQAQRSTSVEHFILFPVFSVGVDPAFGTQAQGITPGRDVGLELGITRNMGKMDIAFQLMVMNGNGINRFGNDSDMPAIASRFQIKLMSMVVIGLSGMWNPRRTGKAPQLYNETDLIFGADLSLYASGFFLELEGVMRITSYPTTSKKDESSLGARADLGYRLPLMGGHLEPVLRGEYFDESDLFSDDHLLYVTIGVNWHKQVWKHHQFALRLSYTLKLELAESRSLNNDQVNLLAQYRF